MVRERFPESHPTDEEIAAYLGHELAGEARRGVELHLAQCAACRQEVVDATEILKTPRRAHWRALAPVAAAAAVILLFISWPQGERPLTDLLPHRDSPAAAEVAPVPISPIGPTPEVTALVWNWVAGADQVQNDPLQCGGVGNVEGNHNRFVGRRSGLHLVPTGPFVFVEGRRQGRVGPLAIIGVVRVLG